MNEEPQDPKLQDTDLPAAEDDADEISMDELDEDAAKLFDLEEPPGERPTPIVAPRGDDSSSASRDDDEISLEDLDADTAGFFEVSAVGGDEGERASDGQPDDSGDGMFEVQAAPAARSEREGERAQPSQPPSQAQRSSYHSSAQHSHVTTGESESIRRLQNVEVEVVATLGTTRMQIKDILGLHVGSVVELHRLVGEPIDVTLNGRLIARGEVVVVDEKFAIRVNEIAASDE
jgi:flagellar motor switch protein FliN/FliY